MTPTRPQILRKQHLADCCRNIQSNETSVEMPNHFTICFCNGAAAVYKLSYFSFNLEVKLFLLRFSVSDICGAKDCQDSAATSENLSNYQPPNQTSYYIVMGVTTAMSVLSLMLFVFFMPSAKDDAIRNRENKFADSYANEAYLEENKECFNNNNNEDTDPNNNNVKKVSPAIEYQDYNKSEAGGDVDVKVDTSSTTSNIRKSFDMWIEEMRKTFKFFLTIHQCLLAPFQFHMGLTFSFAISEFTRAYVSCVYGLSQVGISMTFFGISSLIVAIIVGRVSSKVGSKPIIGATFIINCSEYIFLLVWVPKEDSSLAVLYGLALVSGVSIGILQTITSELAVLHFPNDTSSAYVAWTFWSGLGFTVQYAWSTSLCVNYKIYVMFGTLLLGTATSVVAEFKYRNQQLSLEKESPLSTKL